MDDLRWLSTYLGVGRLSVRVTVLLHGVSLSDQLRLVHKKTTASRMSRGYRPLEVQAKMSHTFFPPAFYWPKQPPAQPRFKRMGKPLPLDRSSCKEFVAA